MAGRNAGAAGRGAFGESGLLQERIRGLRRLDRRDCIHTVHGRFIYDFGTVGTAPAHARAKAAVQRSARSESTGGVERPAAVPADGSSTGGLPGMPPRTCPAGRRGAPVRQKSRSASVPRPRCCCRRKHRVYPERDACPQWLPSPETWMLNTRETLLHSPLWGMGWPQLIVRWQFPPFHSDPRLCYVVGGLQA